MDYLTGEITDGLRLDGRDVAVLVQIEVRYYVAEYVRAYGGYGKVRKSHNQIGLAVLPGVGIRELAQRRHIGRVSPWRPRIDPLDDRGDLLVRQRRIVLELLDTDPAIEVPRRHHARGDAIPDRPCPGPHLLIGDQRHRRDLVGPMTGDARPLEDRRHISRERDFLVAGRRGLRGCDRRHHHQEHTQQKNKMRLLCDSLHV